MSVSQEIKKEIPEDSVTLNSMRTHVCRRVLHSLELKSMAEALESMSQPPSPVMVVPEEASVEAVEVTVEAVEVSVVAVEVSEETVEAVEVSVEAVEVSEAAEAVLVAEYSSTIMIRLPRREVLLPLRDTSRNCDSFGEI